MSQFQDRISKVIERRLTTSVIRKLKGEKVSYVKVYGIDKAAQDLEKLFLSLVEEAKPDNPYPIHKGKVVKDWERIHHAFEVGADLYRINLLKSFQPITKVSSEEKNK